MENNKTFLEKIKDLSIFDSFKIVWFLMIFVVIYYVFIAANRYVSTIELSVRSVGGNEVQTNSLLSLLNSSASTNDDIKYLQAYINSLDMLKILEQKIDIKKLYQEQFIDLPFAIYNESSQESFLKYYQSMVSAKIDDKSGLLKIEVQGFSPESSYLIAKTIMQESEKFINEISHKGAREQMAFAENELEKFKQRYQKAQNDLIEFQNKYGVFDPLKQAETKARFISEIEANIAKKEATLLNLQSYMNDIAPEVVALKSEIVALKKQLKIERAKIASKGTNQKLNNLAVKFQDLTIEANFMQSAYTAALKAYESARIEALRKIKQLVIVQSPTLPQSAKYPERIYDIVTAFMIFSLIFGIFKFVKMIIEEHRY